MVATVKNLEKKIEIIFKKSKLFFFYIFYSYKLSLSKNKNLITLKNLRISPLFIQISSFIKDINMEGNSHRAL